MATTMTSQRFEGVASASAGTVAEVNTGRRERLHLDHASTPQLPAPAEALVEGNGQPAPAQDAGHGVVACPGTQTTARATPGAKTTRRCS
jgi:hypothetical protein